MRGRRILGLKKYQGRNPNGYFQDLTFEAQRRARNWLWPGARSGGSNLPQWRFAILVGQAKRLALNPRQRGVVACGPRKEAMRCSAAIRWRGGTPLNSPPRYTVPRLGCARRPNAASVWGCHHSLDIGSCRSDCVTSSGGTDTRAYCRNVGPIGVV